MKLVELYGRVRYAVRIEGISSREAARRFVPLGRGSVFFTGATGSLRGMPFFDPPMYPTKFAPEPRLRFLKDELETVVLGGYFEDGIWRPSKDEITFDELRALADMKAGTLYRLTCKRLVLGLIRRGFGDSGAHTAELRFLTIEVMRWAVVLRALARR